MAQTAVLLASSAKYQQILDGARKVFLEAGFEGASVDDIARQAGVSKGTMYNYFPDKRALFAAVVHQECQEQASRIFQIERTGSDDVEQTLRRIAHGFVQFLMTPFAQGMFRIAVAEAPRFPDLGRALYESGPELGTRRLSEYLAYACGRGVLKIDDIDLAAHQFTELCKSRLFHRTLLGIQREVTDAEIDAVADAAATTFLRAFRAPQA